MFVLLGFLIRILITKSFLIATTSNEMWNHRPLLILMCLRGKIEVVYEAPPSHSFR